MRTVSIAPMTTKGQEYPTRIACRFREKEGQVVLDQIRTVDKSRLIWKLGKIDIANQSCVIETLIEMFSL